MNKKILRYQLRALLEVAPDFNAYTPDSEVHLGWMNSIHTLIYQWKPFPAIAVANAIEFMPSEAERSRNIEQIFSIAHHAIEQLQVEIEVMISSGAASTNHSDRDLATLVSTANQHLFVVDSDCDLQKLQFYLDSLKEQVKLRLCPAIFAVALDTKTSLKRFSEPPRCCAPRPAKLRRFDFLLGS